MAAFHVFVEGPVDSSPAGMKRLAEAISTHYGLPAADLLARISAGRFRVKGNCDRATAETYVRDLERLGARCAIEPSSPQNARPATPLPFPAVDPGRPPPRPVAAPPPARPSTPPARASTPPAGVQYQSGLAAAFSEQGPSASLGALEREDVSFSLASVDGGDATADAPGDAAFAPPSNGGLSASIGPPPATKPASEPKPAKPKDIPVDMFAPPDADDAAMKVDIAADELEFSARKRASTPPASVPVVPAPETPAAGTPAMRRSAPVAIQSGPVAMRAPSKLGPLADERIRTIAGAVIAILLGFLPAHLFASSREKSAFAAVDSRVIAFQTEADTPDAYAGLDQMRAAQLDRKESERRNIAILAILIWAAVGGGLGYVWFRRIPWDELE